MRAQPGSSRALCFSGPHPWRTRLACRASRRQSECVQFARFEDVDLHAQQGRVGSAAAARLEALGAAALGEVVQLAEQAPRKLVHERGQRLRNLRSGSADTAI